MKDTTTTSPAKAGPDYDRLAFLEIPPHDSRVVAQHRCANKAEHAALLAQVKARKNYLYFATVVWVGKSARAVPPFLVDWDSIPDHPHEVRKQAEAKQPKVQDPLRWDRGLSCPFCDHKINSTPGRTLHVKFQHPDRLEEYRELLRGTKPAKDEDDQWVERSKRTMIEADEEDVVTVLAEIGEAVKLKCPFCGRGASSTSGRTLHVKNKHPDRLSEYLQNVVSGAV